MSTAPGPNQFGKYTVLARIGTGGMAEVFKCRRAGIGGFDKVVVIKRILPDLIHEPEIVTMFLDEARLAANLSHPNIIQIYEIDEVDGLPYIAMEYVKGPTFRAMLGMQKRAKLPFEIGVAAKVMSGISSALHYVHNTRDSDGKPMGLIHRDVSPPNILVSSDGVPKLLDFGVAKALNKASVTKAGTVKGKLKFMPPEQMRTDLVLDHRADVFSAGVCLYQATTGKLPYSGEDDVQIMLAAARGEFAPPSALVPGYPPELEKIVLWAMAPDRDQRCPDAGALHEALETFVGAGPFATSMRTVKEHIALLFPHLEDDSRGAIEAYSASAHTPSLSSLSGSAPGAPRPAPPDPGPDALTRVREPPIFSPRGRWIAAGALALAGVVAGIVWAVTLPPPGPVAIAPPVAVGVVDPEAEARAKALERKPPAPVVPAVPTQPVAAVDEPAVKAPGGKQRPGKPPPPKKGKKPVEVAAVSPAPAESVKTVAPAPVEPAHPAPAPAPAPTPTPAPTPAPAPSPAPAGDDFGCKDDTVAKGAGPPRGTYRWCELPDGTKHGRAVRWYPNGVKAEEGEYKNGKKNGRWIEYFESGLERERTDWRRGVKAW